MVCTRFALAVAAALAVLAPSIVAAGPVNTTATYAGGSGTQSWTVGTNWSSTPDHPSGIGAGAIFNDAAFNRSVNVTAVGGEGPVTVGSITINNATAFQMRIIGGTSDITPSPLTFDAVGAGPATITVTGNSTGSAAPNEITARTVFADTVVASVDPNNNSSISGDLDWEGQVNSSPGGFTKTGDGLLTLSTDPKLYTGATLLSGGRTRISTSGAPTATSSFTVSSGAQLELISSLSYTFGSGPLNLNGSGATTGPFAVFPGAIRNATNVAATITNDVMLQSNTLIHVQGVATGSTTLSGDVGGAGRLDFTAPASDSNQGRLVLTGTNSYAGGSVVNGGSLVAGGISTTAFGLGNVSVQSFANGAATAAASKIIIEAGAFNAINDSATLSLAGGNVAGVADDGYADLAAGINETVGSLILGGVTQGPGTYNSGTHPEYFAGSGSIIVSAAVEDADFDGDGDVDGADFLTWQRGVGGANGTDLQDGNANNDAFIDGDDLAIWENQFGTATVAAGSVPEPSTALIALLAAPLAVLVRRKR